MQGIESQYHALLIDLDGTMYHGDTPIAGADQLIHYLRDHQIAYRFVTNNSSATAQQVADKLNKMGIEAAAGDVCTSAQATASYIAANYEQPRVYMIGEQGLLTALEEAGIIITDQNPNIVVQGIDREYTYEKGKKAVQFIRAGAVSIMTNPDLLLPSNEGLVPGAGSIGAMISASSGQQPIIVGKPSQLLIQFALDQLHIKAEQALVIGDNMNTDIAAGVNAGCGTALVYTGLTNADNYEYYSAQAQCVPDHIFNTLDDLRLYITGLSLA